MKQAYLDSTTANPQSIPFLQPQKFVVGVSSVGTAKSLVGFGESSDTLTSSTKLSDDSYTFVAEDPLYLKISAIFWNAKKELFEDGMENLFLTELGLLIKEHKSKAIEHITRIILHEKSTPEISGESLRLLGRIEDEESYEFRRWLLEQSLLNLSSLRVKDGAILGLASMDDKRTIPKLISAINKEKNIELKKDMELVLKQLES
jgi:hypothetical protein